MERHDLKRVRDSRWLFIGVNGVLNKNRRNDMLHGVRGIKANKGWETERVLIQYIQRTLMRDEEEQ